MGHSLSIEQPDGHLKITDASKMVICPNFELVNKDSITMLGLFGQYIENDGLGQGDSATGGSSNDTICQVEQRPFFLGDVRYSNRTAIVIEENAALILEPGSYTNVGTNSTIQVKKGGTLLIMNGATLEIGSEHYPGFGEVLADSGSYICIETGAIIKFHDDGEDTLDRHIFFTSYEGVGAMAGKNPLWPPLLNTPPYDGVICTPLCSLKNNNIVDNARHGWSNVNDPFAHFIVNDTFCYGDIITLDARRSLNETRYRFKICEWDTIADTCLPVPFWTPWDTGSVMMCNFNDYFTFIADKNYKIQLFVENSCGEVDDTSRIIYLKSMPNVFFTAPDTVCSGYGTIVVDGSTSTPGHWHDWLIESIEAPQDVPEDFEDESVFRDTSYVFTDTTVSDSFYFPNFYVKGGRAYRITLRLYNYCGMVSMSDTVYVPLQATIANKRPVVTFAGADSITLYGVATGGNAFEWKYSTNGKGGPYNYLSGKNDTMNVAPSVSTWYVLSAGTNCEYFQTLMFFEPDPIDSTSEILGICDCIERDTIFVQVNLYALSGNDTTICQGDSATIGIPGILPSGYTAVWRPAYNIKDSTELQTKVAPDSTVSYTLYVYNNGVLEETDSVNIYVDTIPWGNFGMYLGDGGEIYFENWSSYNPGTTYLWTFGDGDSSIEVNPQHLYAYNDTAFEVCLTVSNACGDSTVCDSLYLPIDSAAYWNKKGTSAIAEEVASEMVGTFSILNIVPNPSTGLIKVIYEIPPHDYSSRLIITNIHGRNLGQYRLSPDRATLELDLNNLASGTYMAFIQSNNGQSRVVKFLIAK